MENLAHKISNGMDKIISIYKPKGPTSFDIIREFQRAFGKREKIGHGGTLDPLASGVLVVALGREATKKIHEVVGADKEYLAKICLGATSTTDDSEGEKSAHPVAQIPQLEEVRIILGEFVGEIMQTPPIYSALKIHGKPAYKFARKGQDIEMKPRVVKVFEAELLDYKWPFVDVRFVTGPGVYIRALARDIGEKLGTGGYLACLERIRVGKFTKENSVSAEEAIKEIESRI